LTGQILDFNSARKQGELAKNGIDVDDIRDRLHANPRAFVDWLYSGRAYCVRNQARIGNVYGEQGSSLAIDLGSGLWKDHATDAGGDLISLYRAWRGYQGESDFLLSLKEIARDFLGDSQVEIERPAWQPSPAVLIEKRKAELGSKPRDENLLLGAPVATYRYYDLHGKIIASVVRFEPDGTRDSKTFRPWCFKPVDGKQKWVMGAPDMRPLYRLPEIATSPTVVLCEGEGCADALASIGIVATSAMQGAKAPIEKTDWSPLAGKKVIIWPDKDAPGIEYAKRVSERLLALGCTVLGITPPDDAREKWDAADCVAEGRDPHALIAGAVPVSAKAKQRIRILSLDEIENLAPPSFLIEEVLTESGLSMLWGRSGAMKSFVALDMAMCVATGTTWHGKATRQGLVIYVAAEGSHGLGRRAIGWRKTRGRGLPQPMFKLIPHSVALTSDDLDAMVTAILDLGGKPPALIIIDTLARTFGTGDENKQADMNAYVTAADRLREATGANVMIVHHSGVHEDKRERGSNVLRGAADTVIKVSRKDDNLDIINAGPEGKQKDAEEFKTIKLRTAKVAFEQGGQEQTTLILNLREEDDTAKADSQTAPQKMGKNEEAILKELKRASQPLGLMRLEAMTRINKGSLVRSLASLVEKGMASVEYDASGNSKLWSAL
jgi:hypothetical protein